VSAPDSSRVATLQPGSTPVRVETGTADVFALRADGARYPLCSLDQGQCAFPASEGDLLIVARLDASLAEVEGATEAQDLQAFVSALGTRLPGVQGVQSEDFPSALHEEIQRLMEQDAARRRKAILADEELSAEELQREFSRIAFSVETTQIRPVPWRRCPWWKSWLRGCR
jgi:hypothetical protein